jgi:hypothetical protein
MTKILQLTGSYLMLCMQAAALTVVMALIVTALLSPFFLLSLIGSGIVEFASWIAK